MRGLILIVTILLASALIISVIGGSRCERMVANVEKQNSFQVVTTVTDCGGRDKATEVGLAALDAVSEDADTFAVLPGEQTELVTVKELETRIAVTFPKGSKLVAKSTSWQGRPIEFVPQSSPQNAEPAHVD